ncbi:MAG TPA: hypothetical protein VGJ22_07250 [Anaerolineales bacterium]|jgi:hypothetical protein
MDGKIGLRIVAALVLVAAIAGIGFFAYQAGVAQGSPVTIQAPAGEPVPAPYPYYGYGMPFHHPFGFGFGCFGLLLPLFLLLIALKAFRVMLWGPRWGHMHHNGPWGRHSEGGPPFFEEWHKRAHGEQPEDDKKE